MSVCAERLGIGECSKNRLAVPRVPQGTRVLRYPKRGDDLAALP